MIVVLCTELFGSYCGLRCHPRWSKTSNKQIKDGCSSDQSYCCGCLLTLLQSSVVSVHVLVVVVVEDMQLM